MRFAWRRNRGYRLRDGSGFMGASVYLFIGRIWFQMQEPSTKHGREWSIVFRGRK